MREYKVSSKKHYYSLILLEKSAPLQTSKKKSFEIFVQQFNPILNFEGVGNLNFNLDWFILAEGPVVLLMLKVVLFVQLSIKPFDHSLLLV